MASTTSLRKTSAQDFRLPVDVKPTHYDIALLTDLRKETFSGFIKIDLDIVKKTSSIVFNAADLTFGEAIIASTSQGQVEEIIKTSVVVDTDAERASVDIPTLPAGSKAQLRLSYAGKFGSNMMGYYKSSWQPDGQQEFYSLTQFEATSARKAFPCWDEPLFKATFAITMISKADTVNLSNMPVVSETAYTKNSENDSLVSQLSALSLGEHEHKWDLMKITKFATTPPMSTYLVAFANGRFKYLETSYKSPLTEQVRPLRIYATSDVLHQAQFALDVMAKSLPLYEIFFDVEYPLPKLDILVANDFDAGAMENWGLITGRTSAFLLDPVSSDVAAQKQVTVTTCHEVAHMWFGDITTMAWWDNLYLNEGFATLMGEVFVIEKINPEWKPATEFVNNHMESALNLDAKLSSHAIEVPIPDPNQIDQIFDALSYSKAASVLLMLSTYVGEDKFLKGVSIYLKEHLYANSVTKDLWDGISEASGTNVTSMMNNWVTEMGFPFIEVSEVQGGIRVRQDRLLATGPAESKDNKTIWTVPLAILSVDKDGKAVIDNTAVFDTKEASFPLDTTKPWKVNAGCTGFYRVLYTPERLEKIAKEAATEGSIFSLNDRLSLINDNIALAKAGLSPTSESFKLIEYFENEREYLVWDSISASLSTVLTTWWENQKVTDLAQQFRKTIFAPIVERLGFEYDPSESADTSLLRTAAITASAQSGDNGVVKKLQSWFAELMKTVDDPIPADLQKITYMIAVRHGGRGEYDAVKTIYEKPKTPTARLAAIRAMCATKDSTMIQETFDFVLTKAKDQDFLYFFTNLATETATRRHLVEFFQNNYDTIYGRFAGTGSLSRLVNSVYAQLSTEEDAKASEEFFKDKDTSKYALALAQAIDGIRAKAQWIDKSTSDVQSWLEGWSKKQ